jgi:hypothetical protein
MHAWNLILSRGFADKGLAGEFLSFLMQQHAYEVAADSWAAYLGLRANDYRKTNWLYDGDFEAVPLESLFDWRIDQLPEVEVERDKTVAYSGSHSLRIFFRGEGNLTYANIHRAVVPAGIASRLSSGPKRFDDR